MNSAFERFIHENGYMTGDEVQCAALAWKAATERKDTLLHAAHALLTKCSGSGYVKNVLEETVFYDGAECDGMCLMEDIALELDLD